MLVSEISNIPHVEGLYVVYAPETKVFKLWEGLGYYTRCKNLIATAKYISTDLKGKSIQDTPVSINVITEDWLF